MSGQSSGVTVGEVYGLRGRRDGVELPCWSADPELFFPESPGDVDRAKSLCRECPVRLDCLAGALERREPWGVWGGELFDKGAVVPFKRPAGGRARARRLRRPPPTCRFLGKEAVMSIGNLKAGARRAAGRDNSGLLRLALQLDAAASGLLGVLLVAAGAGIDEILGIPAAVLMSIGIVLIGYASLLWTIGTLRAVPIPVAWGVVVGNFVWVAASVIAAAADWWTPTGAGTASILVQAVAVASLAGLQILGLRAAVAAA